MSRARVAVGLFFAGAIGCATIFRPEGVVSSYAVAPAINQVCDRHDAYVSSDGLISPEERDQALQESEDFRTTLTLAGDVPVDLVAPRARPVLDRHDAYVTKDPTLTPTYRRAYFRTSILLREMFGMPPLERP